MNQHHMLTQSHRIKFSFTLIEMLVVVGVIAVLLALLMPALGNAVERSRRAACLNNLSQMIRAALMYANDDSQGNLSNALHDTNDDFTFLYPNYVSTLKTFICPSTQNFIRRDTLESNTFTGQWELSDLTAYAGNITNAGTSYELFGFMNFTEDTPNYSTLYVFGTIARVKGVKKNLSSVQRYQHIYNSFGLKGIIPGPSQIWLMLDGDEPPGHQNYPDPNNNHGASGGNVSFCDGHVSWIPVKEYLYRYELSQDENRTTP